MKLAKILIVSSILLAGCATPPQPSTQVASTNPPAAAQHDDDNTPMTGTIIKHHRTDVQTVDVSAFANAMHSQNSSIDPTK